MTSPLATEIDAATDAAEAPHAPATVDASRGQASVVTPPSADGSPRFNGAAHHGDAPATNGTAVAVRPRRPRRRGAPARWFRHLVQRGERKLSRLAGRSPFWHRVLSWRFLPLAFRSGIRFEKGNIGTFSAVLPFRRFNRNWYNAMAGGALLGNAEIVGGMYVFNRCGAEYTVVCKELSYKFLRPCIGPAVYQCRTEEDLDALVDAGGEFNITIDIEVKQMVNPKDDRQRRVGKCTARFHITPKSVWRERKKRRERARYTN